MSEAGVQYPPLDPPWLYTLQAGWAAYAIAIIAVYWVTEAVPLAVTALLPLVLFPAVHNYMSSMRQVIYYCSSVL